MEQYDASNVEKLNMANNEKSIHKRSGDANKVICYSTLYNVLIIHICVGVCVRVHVLHILHYLSKNFYIYFYASILSLGTILGRVKKYVVFASLESYLVCLSQIITTFCRYTQ